jgi:sulfur-oxidizing protein SoxB
MQGADMVEAANLLGIDAMTGHWEFTYGEKALRSNLDRFKGEFLAQNVFLTEEAAFNDAKAFDPASGRVFKPATIKEIGGSRVAVIGQAFPYVPIAHPKRFTPDWKFGIRDAELQKLVDSLRNNDRSTPWCCCRTTAWMSISAGEPRHRHRRHPRWPHPTPYRSRSR